MIRFEPVPRPEGFEIAETKGATWLAEHPDGRPPDRWSAFKSRLADGFRDLCGFGAMYEPVGTVDHFVSCDEDRRRAYDWTNYRYASAWLNSSKQHLRSNEILDPFEVHDDWFELLLPSLQLVMTAAVPPALRDRAETMLGRLHLGHDERIMRQRRAWYRLYETGKLDLEGLATMAPLIARAVRKQQARG